MFSDVPVVVVDGAPAVRAQAYKDAKDARSFVIVGYEQVIKDVRVLSEIASEIVVLDEAQRMKNWATKTSLSIQMLQPRRRLVLTGTPMENRIDELANIISWVDDRTLAPRWRLAPAHLEYVDGKQEIGGSRDLSGLRARLAPVFLRRRRADVLGKLPSRTDNHELVPFTAEQSGAHESLNSHVRRLVAIAAKRPLTPPEFLRLMSLLTMMRILCNGLALAEFEETWPELRDQRVTDKLLDELAAPKLIAFRALVKKLVVDEGKKVVVFSQWRRMLQLAQWSVRDILDTNQLRSMFFSGQERTKRRTQNLVDFHDDPAARILFATDAGGVGLNLQHASSVVINIEPPWNPAVLEQRIGRVHRNGQLRPVEVFHLLTRGGIEERVRELVGNKRALFDGLFDGAEDTVTFERSGTFLERLQRVSEPSAPGEPKPSAPPVEPEIVAPAAPPSAAELFAQLQVSRASDGSLTMTVAPSAAPFIAAMLRSWASALDDH
jgi:SNF2 family DNA or RNA helicase